MANELNAIAALAYREIVRFLRDKARIAVTFLFPMVFIGILGAGLQSNLSEAAGYSFITFAFTGVLAQVLFQTTAIGVISLNEDRQHNLIQEVFVAPVSRYTILLGKIAGECLVAFTQCAGVLIFGSLIGIEMTAEQIAALLPIFLVACLLGGAFGVFVLSFLPTVRAAYQIFALVIIPQIFLGGVFTPIKDLPFHLYVPSRLVPLTYAVDMVRSVFYRGLPEYEKVVLYSTHSNLIIAAVFFLLFLVIGTFFFVRNERNK